MSFSAHRNGPVQKRALCSVFKIEHVACRPTYVRKIILLLTVNPGLWNGSRCPTRTDIDADDFVS
jgi:hypothetical protein